MKKLLTITVPAYNAEKYLNKCLDSFLLDKVMHQLDVIIVNDGSTDRTQQIAERYRDQYPGTFRVINKENGGHGSAINAGINVAWGKYFKVVDADDWVITKNLPILLEELDQTQADVVLTHFHTVHMMDGFITPIQMKNICFGRVYSLEEFIAEGKDARICCMFHGVMYRKEFYQNCGLKLPEKVFYEDQDFVTIPFKNAHSILPLDIFFYQYLIGNTEQSVSDINQVKRIGMIESSLWRIIDSQDNEMSSAAREYFTFKLREILLSCYGVMLIKNRDRRAGLADARRLRKQIAQKAPKLNKATGRQYRVTRFLHMLGFTGDTLVKLKSSEMYLKMRRFMH